MAADVGAQAATGAGQFLHPLHVLGAGTVAVVQPHRAILETDRDPAGEQRIRLDPGAVVAVAIRAEARKRSEEHTSELQSLMRISYAVFCLKKKTKLIRTPNDFLHVTYEH